MIVLLIILCVLLTAVIVLSVWGYTLLSKKIDYVYGNQSILYQKILEAEIPVLCSYLGVLERLVVRRWLMNGMKMYRG